MDRSDTRVSEGGLATAPVGGQLQICVGHGTHGSQSQVCFQPPSWPSPTILLLNTEFGALKGWRMFRKNVAVGGSMHTALSRRSGSRGAREVAGLSTRPRVATLAQPGCLPVSARARPGGHAANLDRATPNLWSHGPPSPVWRTRPLPSQPCLHLLYLAPFSVLLSSSAGGS